MNVSPKILKKFQEKKEGGGSKTVWDFSKKFQLFYEFSMGLLVFVPFPNANVFNLVPTYMYVILSAGSWFLGSIFLNFPEYFFKFSRVFFWVLRGYFSKFLVFFWICQPKLSEDLLFFVVTSIFPNSYEYFLTFLTEFPEYFFRIWGIFQNFSTIIKWRPFFLFLVLTSIFPEFPEHFQNFEYFP